MIGTDRKTLRPWIVARPALTEALDRAPARFTIAPADRFDPLRVASSPFIDAVERLDATIFEPRGLATPRWALFDCAALPGMLFGLGRPASVTGAGAAARAGAGGRLEPRSLLAAIPRVGGARWHVYTLASALGDDLDAATMGLGLEVLRALAVGEGAGALRRGGPGRGKSGGGGETLGPADELLGRLVPFVVAPPENLPFLELSPFGVHIAEDARIDPAGEGSRPFLDLLARLDALTFGPEGMPMPRWLFLDGAAIPGAIVGLARRADDLSDKLRAMFEVPAGYRGLVPLSMYIAVPAAEEGAWVGHNLASVAEQVPEEGLAGLGRVTKALALKVYTSRAQIGATQWASRALHVHARMGALELLSAWTPAHGGDPTLTYRVALDDAALRSLAGDPAAELARPEPSLWLDSEDRAAMIDLEQRIERGERFCITGAPRSIGPHRQSVPVARIEGRSG